MTVLKRGNIADREDAVGFLRGIAAAFSYLTPVERRWTWVLLASTTTNAVLGFVGIASVLPFFKIMVEPDPLASNGMLGTVLAAIGVTSAFQAIVVAGALLVGMIGLKNCYAILHVRIVNRFCSRVESRVATDTLTRIVYAPFSWYIRQNAAILRDVVTIHVVEWSRGVIRPTLYLVNNGLMLLTVLALVIPFTPWPALLIGAFVLSIGLGFVALVRPKVTLSSNRKKRSGLLAGVAAAEAISGGRDVRMSRAGRVLIEEFHREYSVYAYSDADSRQWQLIPRLGIEVVGVAAIVAMALGALASGISRTEAATILALYAVVAIRLMPIIGEVSSSISAIQSSLPQLTYLRSLHEDLPAPDTHVVKKDRVGKWREVTFKGVSYRYANSDQLALENIDILFKRGCSYGLIGASGAGKSTVADIVAGLLVPTSGTLAIDGVDVVDTESRTAWRSRISYVAQHPVIFDATFADNILLGEPPSADREQRLAAAISSAGLTSVVNSLEKNQDTQIGDRGTRLSGGQRQRVAIARAAFQRAELLILDEATSALDSLTEREIGEAIEALKGQVTVIAIAHRLSTVMHCDEIILLDHGHIVARGSHDELMSRSDEYRRFVEAQSMSREFVTAAQ